MRPEGIYETVLNYFARSFLCIQALRLDPNVNKAVSDVFADSALLLDANVLIPLTAEHEDRFELVDAAVRAAKNAGIALYTSERFLQEVRRHAQWALDRTFEFGSRSSEVMKAARGLDGYQANAYLRGFINKDPSGSDPDFLNYLRECFGGSFAGQDFREYFESQLGIKVINQSEMDQLFSGEEELYGLVRRRMESWNSLREETEQKSDARIDAEIEAFTLTSGWASAKDCISHLDGTRCGLLTLGSSVARMANNFADRPERARLLSPQALWELLVRLQPEMTGSQPNFRSLMNTSYFQLSEYFIDTERYREFFRPAINAARQDFERLRPTLEDILGIGLGADTLDEYPEEDIPDVVASLEGLAVHKMDVERQRYQTISNEVEELRARVREYEDRERRRQEYVTRQRLRDQQRRRARRT